MSVYKIHSIVVNFNDIFNTVSKCFKTNFKTPYVKLDKLVNIYNANSLQIICS